MSYGMDYEGGGGGGGFGGGGGSHSGGGFGGGDASTQASGGRLRKSYDEQTIQPCTISMILKLKQEGDDGSLQLPDGRSVYHVSLVGAVRDFNDNSTNTEYQIEDGTGLIVVKQWLNESDCAAKMNMRAAATKENIYVKVVGTVKYYDGGVTLIAESIRPISSGNELTHHMLEVVYVGEKIKRQHQIVPPQAGLMSMNQGVGFGGGIGGVSLQQQTGSGDSLRDAVISFIKREGEHAEMGASVTQCIQSLGAKFGEPAVRKAIDDLASEGNIYSTINEDFYKFAM